MTPPPPTPTPPMTTTRPGSRRPPDTALRQQRLLSYKPMLDPTWTIGGILLCAAIFVPTGHHLSRLSESIPEINFVYDPGDCSIDRANRDRVCELSLEATQDMRGPVLVYYGVTNFFQNHRTYFRSVDFNQLQGGLPKDQTVLAAENCDPLREIGGVVLNPCGLRANTLFNDVFELLNDDLTMREDGVAFSSDAEYRYGQPEGFRKERCASCDQDVCDCAAGEWSCREPYVDEDGACWRYFYPDDDTTQYLYETYPMVVNPLEGVMNEHFMVWMRTAVTKNFRKLYGWIEDDVPKGTVLRFRVRANWEVSSFDGSKALIVTTSNWLGGRNDFLGKAVYVTGYCCLAAGVFFGLKQTLNPRRLADRSYLEYKED